MDTYRNPQASKMLLSFITTGQDYPQENVFSLLGTHKIGATELRSLQRGSIVQGVENDVDPNVVGVLRFSPKVKAYRLRPFIVADSDPSGIEIKLGLAVYPKFTGDKLQGNSQGVVQATVEDTARTAGTQGEITLVAASSAIDIFTSNPLTGQDWLEDFVDLGSDEDSVTAGESLSIYPIVDTTVVGAFGRILTAEGFDASNPDSGYLLLDPAFNEYLLVRMLNIDDTDTVRGILLAVESET